MQDIVDFKPIKYDMLFGSIIDDLVMNSTLYTSIIFKHLVRVFKSVSDVSTDYKLSVSRIGYVTCFNFLFKTKDFNFMVIMLAESRNTVKAQNNFLLNRLTKDSNDFIEKSNIKINNKIELNKIDSLQSKYKSIYNVLLSVFRRFNSDINYNDYGYLETNTPHQTRIHGMGDITHTKNDGVSIYYIFDFKNKVSQ